MKLSFEDYLLEKNDRIDNAAHNLLNEMAEAGLNGEEKVEWNMSLIGEITDFVGELLKEYGIQPCHPFYEGEEEIECPKGNDCKRTDCPFRKKS